MLSAPVGAQVTDKTMRDSRPDSIGGSVAKFSDYTYSSSGTFHCLSYWRKHGEVWEKRMTKVTPCAPMGSWVPM